MHEVALLNGMLDQLQRALSEEGQPHIRRVNLRIGYRSGVDPKALEFAFEATCGHHKLLPKGAELDILMVTAEADCSLCGHQWAASEFLLVCPSCGSYECVAKGGDQLIIDTVEVE